MKAKRRIVVAMLAVAVVGGLIWLFFHWSEPSYQGKSLSAWLEEAYQRKEISNLPAATRIETRSANAIRAMGPKTLPHLLRMARTPDSELRRTLLKLSEKQDWVPMHIQPFEEVQGKAAYGFTVLGASAEPAVPALIAMLEGENFEVRVLAAFCLYRIGPAAKDAVPALQKFLEAATHSKVHPQRSWHERYWPARVLGAIGLAARPALPQLRALTNDADLLVRESAHAALIKITGEGLDPFVAMLKDSSNLTNWLSAARVVQLVGTNAAAAIPFLVPALQYTNQSMCGNAIQALGTIHMQPEVCIPALTPFLQATNDWLRLHTLEAIREFGRSAGPALPTAEIIRCLQDSSGLVRQQATNTLRQVAPEAAAKAGVD